MAIVGALPNILLNGTIADASQVMADFNFIVNQVNANALPIGTLQTGAFLSVQIFTSSGSYNPNPLAKSAIVHVVGGGGGGGAGPITSTGQVGIGTGGGGGGYAIGQIVTPVSTVITVGAAGAGGTSQSTSNASVGGAGGNSSYGATIVAPGGVGGNAAGPSAPPFAPAGTSTGSVPTGGTILNSQGGPGGIAWANSVLSTLGGNGCPGPFGGGGNAGAIGTTAGSAFAPGAGGGGASTPPNTVGGNGGAGGKGIVIIYEYA